MAVVLSKMFISTITKSPLLRGMAAYGILWPVSSLVQQSASGNYSSKGYYDWATVARFGLYGGLFMAPALYGWIRITSRLWPKNDLRTAIIKVSTKTSV